MKKTILPVFFTLLSLNGFGQSETLDKVSQALKAGNSRELAKYFHENVEYSEGGDVTKSSKTHVEFLIRDFFKKYPPKDFNFSHKGASREGSLSYAIGSYSSQGAVFRFFVRLKKYDDQYLIYALDFTKE